MRRNSCFISLLAIIGLAGCAAPDLGAPPQMATPTTFASAHSLFAATQSAWPVAEWWHAYGDPQLDALIGEALSGAPDIAIAAARIRAARGTIERVGAAGLPRIDANVSAGVDKQSYNNGIPTEFVPKGWNDVGKLSLSGSFDLDLWGRNRASLAAATSEAEATRLDGEQAALMLTTDVVSAYADLARLFSERDVLERALELRSATAKLVSQRVSLGLDTQGELKQSTSAIPASRVELAANGEQIDLTRNRISALIGSGPDRGRQIARPAVPVLGSVGLPADAGIELVGRRPDIAAARARADAAANRIKVARAEFYPNVSLSGLIGLQSLGLSNLIKGSSSYGNLGPAISLPIFHGGELRGRYRETRGRYDEAVATYDRILLAALREVSDAVTSRNAIFAQRADAKTALDDAEGAYQVAQLRYKGGLSTFLNVLSAEETVLTARRTLADIEARRFILDAALVRALGGGFRTA